MENKLKEAVELLCENLKSDETYYYSWQANIAMAFKDEYARNSPVGSRLDNLHELSNNAAKNFLNQLIAE